MLRASTLLVVLVALLWRGSSAAPSPSPAPSTLAPTAAPTQQVQQWTQWKSKCRKVYNGTLEDNRRFGNFRANLQLAAARNNLEKGGKTIHGVTPLSDLSPAEFAAQYLTYVKPAPGTGRLQQQRTLATASSSSSTPSTTQGMVDWTGQYTTAVKDQGYCGSCWAFSAVEQVESDAARVLGLSVTLSAQQVTSCDKGSAGCSGGNPITAYIYLQGTPAVSEAIYPYASGLTGTTGRCAADPAKGTVKVASYYQLSSSTAVATETLMAAYVQSTGPLSIAVAATTWQTYVGGLMTVCPSSPVNHAVQAVGVDVGNGVWKIRNSWGTGWGESGYIRVGYGSDLCGISSLATYTTPAAFVPPTPAPTIFRSASPTTTSPPVATPTQRPSSPPVARPTWAPFSWPTKAPVAPTTPRPTLPPVPTKGGDRDNRGGKDNNRGGNLGHQAQE